MTYKDYSQKLDRLQREIQDCIQASYAISQKYRSLPPKLNQGNKSSQNPQKKYKTQSAQKNDSMYVIDGEEFPVIRSEESEEEFNKGNKVYTFRTSKKMPPKNMYVDPEYGEFPVIDLSSSDSDDEKDDPDTHFDEPVNRLRQLLNLTMQYESNRQAIFKSESDEIETQDQESTEYSSYATPETSSDFYQGTSKNSTSQDYSTYGTYSNEDNTSHSNYTDTLQSSQSETHSYTEGYSSKYYHESQYDDYDYDYDYSYDYNYDNESEFDAGSTHSSSEISYSQYSNIYSTDSEAAVRRRKKRRTPEIFKKSNYDTRSEISGTSSYSELSSECFFASNDLESGTKSSNLIDHSDNSLFDADDSKPSISRSEFGHEKHSSSRRKSIGVTESYNDIDDTYF